MMGIGHFFFLILNFIRVYQIQTQYIQEQSLYCNVTGQADCSDPANIQCQQNYFLFHNYVTNTSILPQQYCVKCPYQNYNDPLALYCMDCVENPYTWDMSRKCTYDYQILNGVDLDGVYTRVDRSSSELYFVDRYLSNDTNLASIPTTYLCEGCDYFCYNTTILDASSPCSLIYSPHVIYDTGHSSVACLPGYFVYDFNCEKCEENCQRCDANGCIQLSEGYYFNSPINGKQVISKCSSKIANCDSCIYNQTSKILQCKSCFKLQSGLQYITSLDLQSCVLCESKCQRCEYTTYDSTILKQAIDYQIYPTRYSYTNDFIIQNSNLYIKKCLQCSIKDYTLSFDGISCEQCTIQNCAKCFYQYTKNINGVQTFFSTLDLNYFPTTQKQAKQCFQCQENFINSYQQDTCSAVSNAQKVQNCSSYQYTDTANTIVQCTKCANTYFYNLDTKKCQIHDPNAETLSGYTKINGQYVLNDQINSTQLASLITNLPYISCSTYLSDCLECYLYKSLDDVGNKITSQYVYQCTNCDIGYYPDFFSGMCLLCKASDQIQSCSACSQYSQTYNYTDYLFSYPRSNTSTKSRLQSLEPVNSLPMCYQCINGYTYFTQTNGCDTCGSNCFTDSCQTTYTETQCTKCWPPQGNYIQRSLSMDHNECIDCPDNCEACRIRTKQEINNVNPDFNTSYTALRKYSLICYKSAFGQFFDTILGMPVSCAQTNNCYHSITLDISLYCSTSDYQANKIPGSYSLQSFYSSNFGQPVISFINIDNSDTYTLYNSKVVQKIYFNINLIQPSIPTQLCSIQGQTNLQIYLTKNIFSLKDLIVTMQGTAYKQSSNISNYDQKSNTIVTLTSYLNFLYLRNIVINGLTFIYPLACSQDLQNMMMSSTIPINWGLTIQQNGLTQLKLQSCTFGANITYLQQMNSSNIFSTNQKLLFKFAMNNVFNLSIIDVNMNYNNFTFEQNISPLSRTFDVPYLAQRYTFINGLAITGLGLYGVPLFVVNDVATVSQYIKVGSKGLTFLFCDFYQGGHIFGEYQNSTSQSGQIDIERMVIQYSSFNQSSIISLKTNINNGSSIRNIDIVGCNFTNSSYAFYMNNLQLTRLYSYMLRISSSSSIIKSQYNIPDDQSVLANSLNLALTQIHFNNIQCETEGCLIALTSPLNTEQLKSNVSINSLIMENTNISAIKDLHSMYSALIQIKDVNFVIIRNLISDNNLAVIIVLIDSVTGVNFYDSVFDSSQAELNSKLSQSNSSLPDNLIPVTTACAQDKQALRQYNNIQIYINQFLYGVYMQNIVFQNLLAIDNSLIYIESYDTHEIDTSIFHTPLSNYDISDTILKTTGIIFASENSTEAITLIGCKFLNNRMVASQTNLQSSIFQANSKQDQLITFINCHFDQNHLHQVAQIQNLPSASCIVIESIHSNVAIISSNFTRNSATQAQYGQIYIQSSQALMSKSLFVNTNIYDESWSKRLQQNNLNASQFQQFFQVVSNGGNAYIKSKLIEIQFCSFNKSQGVMGAGLYLKSQRSGNINIKYSTFENQSSSLEYLLASKGGAIYIDSSNSKLNLQITNTEMRRCQARKSGGCIYIEPSQQPQQVSIKLSHFINCYALTSSFMEVVFPKTSKQMPLVSFDQILIAQNLYNIQKFYYEIPDLQDIEISSISTQNSLYYQYFGIFLLSNSQIENIFYNGALNLQYMKRVNLNQVNLIRSTLFWLPLINIQLSTSTTAQIVLSKIEISGTQEFLAKNLKLQFCQKSLSIIEINDISCNSINNLIQDNTNQNQTNQNKTNQLNSSNQTNYSQINICINRKNLLNSSRYFELFSQTYKNLTEFQKYGALKKIAKKNLINQTIVLTNRDTEFAQDSDLIYDEVYSNYMDCQLTTLLSTLTTDPPMALVSVEGISSMQTFEINKMNLLNNNCSRCFGGLIQVLGVATTSQHSLIQIKDVNCQNNTAGYYGCLTLSNAKILSLIINKFGYTEKKNLLKNEDVTINSSQIQNKRILMGNPSDIVLNELQNLKHAVNIQYSNFVSNNAYVGGGLTIFGLNSLISNVQFVDNKASYMGGGLLFYNTKPENTNVNLYLYRIILQGNTAQVGSAIMLVNSSTGDQNSWNIIFSDNTGLKQTANLVEYPQELSIQTTVGNILPKTPFINYTGERNKFGNVKNSSVQIIDLIQIANYNQLGYPGIAQRLILPSGQKISSYQYYNLATQEQVPFDNIFRIINLNRFHQQVSSVDSSQICSVFGRRQSTIEFNDSKPFHTNYTYPNEFSFDIDKGAYNLDDMIVIFDPELPSTEFLQLKFQCTSVRIPVYSVDPPYNITEYNTNYFLYVNISTFPCQIGEYYVNVPGKDDGRCLSCFDQPKTFAVRLNQIACTPIDLSSMESVNPFMVQTKEGYWRPYDDSPDVSQCYNLDLNCPGGWSSGQDSCFDGHTGALCESCDLSGSRNGERWAQSAPYECGKCSELLTQNTLIIIGISIFTMLSIAASVVGNQDDVQLFIRNQVRQTIGVLVKDTESGLAILVKIFTNYFQVIAAVATFQLSLPEGFSSTVTNVGNPVKSMAVSYDCFFISITHIEVVYFRIIWALLIPFFYLCIILLGYFLAVILKKATYRISIIYTTFIYMFIYLQPNLLGGFMSLASQRKISNFQWVQADVSYRFDTSTHSAWVQTLFYFQVIFFVIPNLIIWAFVLPIGLLINLYKTRHTLNSKHTRERWGYFYNEYRLSAYFWEFVKIFQKELIIIFLIYFQGNVIVKGLLIFFMIFIYGGIALFIRPYRSNLLNFLDMESCVICTVSMIGGVLSYEANFNQLQGLQILFLVLILLINVFFIIQMVILLILGYITKFDEQIDAIRVKIMEKRPNLVKEHPWLRKFMINSKDMKLRVDYLWAQLRYETRQGIKRIRIDKNAPLIQVKSIESVVLNDSNKEAQLQEKNINTFIEKLSADNEDSPILLDSQEFRALRIDLSEGLKQTQSMQIFPSSDTHKGIPEIHEKRSNELDNELNYGQSPISQEIVPGSLIQNILLKKTIPPMRKNPLLFKLSQKDPLNQDE